jgi:hypothetical protein
MMDYTREQGGFGQTEGITGRVADYYTLRDEGIFSATRTEPISR